MSKLLENKQIIHIISEIVVITGITIYFSQQTKKLKSHINDLTQRIDDQDEIIQTHEKKIAQLISTVEQLANNFSNLAPSKNQTQQISHTTETIKLKDSKQLNVLNQKKPSPIAMKNDSPPNLPVENFQPLKKMNLPHKPTVSFSTIIIEKSPKIFGSESKVEEIFEEESETNSEDENEELLDAELEEELKDLK